MPLARPACLDRPHRRGALTLRPAACPRWALACVGAALLMALTHPVPTRANDAPARPAPIKADKADQADKANAAALPPGKDPLDHLRERLADKLGASPAGASAAPAGRAARKAAGGPAPVVSVVNKTSTSDATAAPGAPRPSHRPAAMAPHGAAGVATTRAAPNAAAPAPVPAVAAAAGPGYAALSHGAVHSTVAGAPMAAAPALAVPRELLPPTVPDGHDAAAHWAYEGAAGPSAWGRLKPEFAACSTGKRQSPIDIREGMKLELEPVQFTYLPSAVRVIDNGHTVQVNVAGGNFIEVMGRRYELLQFHFHRPSEERIDGRQFDMVAHLVHRDPEGRLAVIAVLLGRGSAQPLIQTVWNNLPLEKGEEQSVRPLLDLTALLPPDRSYYTYMGSLTTPPCTEGVLWMVMKTPVSVSPEQIAIFSRLYPMNARPVQSLAGRLIKESN